MSFSDRMKELMEQGAAVSKDFMSKAGEKAQDWGERGFHVSKDFVFKAGAKAQDLGERGVLMLEIKQLESQAQKLLARLGSEVYTQLVEQNAPSLDAAGPAVKSLLAELAVLKEGIEKRETELENRKTPV
ncbi:MAG: hypothetical protein LBT11_05780 [Treponema sp.]|jgi:hypothetical protein|nr:hypothetical protein [Treponema sp.]